MTMEAALSMLSHLRKRLYIKTLYHVVYCKAQLFALQRNTAVSLTNCTAIGS